MSANNSVSAEILKVPADHRTQNSSSVLMFELTTTRTHCHSEAGTRKDLDFAVGPVLPLHPTPTLISDPLAAQTCPLMSRMVNNATLHFNKTELGEPHL